MNNNNVHYDWLKDEMQATIKDYLSKPKFNSVSAYVTAARIQSLINKAQSPNLSFKERKELLHNIDQCTEEIRRETEFRPKFDLVISHLKLLHKVDDYIATHDVPFDVVDVVIEN